ncbi:MAG TPA: pyridoxal phosphate-dependent aminotransferase [Acidimicrobiia bacterium]
MTSNTETFSPLRAGMARGALAIRGGEDSAFFTLLNMADERENVIRLGRGEPDRPTPKHIVDAAIDALNSGKTTYTNPAGLPELRQAISRKFRIDNDLDYDPMGEIIVTSGAQEAMVVALQTLLDPGDEVIIASPHYMAYPSNILLAGGKPILVPTYEDQGFELLPEAIEERITERTKLVVLVSPNNPTAGVLTKETMEGIARVIEKHDLLAISDELYEKIVYDGFEPVSFATLPGMRERTITINGFSKAYSMTGFRVGYMAGPRDYIKSALEPRHSLTICAATPSQYAALAALEGPDDFLVDMLAEYSSRRQTMAAAFDRMGVKYSPPLGGFYFFANIKEAGLTAYDFCVKALVDHGLLFTPGSLFGDAGEGFIRIGYLAPESELIEALERFESLWNDLVSSR